MSSPAGWYPQPDGQQRYWDGQQWTEHFATGVTPETPTGAPAPGGAPVVAARKNWFLRHKILTAVGAVLLLGVISSLANGGGNKSDPVASIDQVTTSPTPDKAAGELAAANQAAADKAAAEVAAASKKAEDQAAANQAAADKAAAQPQLGKKVLDGKFAFTVTAIKCGIAQVGTNPYLIKKAQGQFCRASLTVENIGSEAQTMFASNQYLFDTKGRKLSADATANIYDDSAKLMFEEINPGNSIKGFVYFDVPKGTVVSKLELHDSAFSGGIQVRL